MARQVQDPQQRDAQLGAIAAAQAGAGARQAAVRTVAEVGDGLARAHVLAQIGAQGVGGNPGGQGGAAQADFQALMDLITSTVSPKSWEANGGQGTIVAVSHRGLGRRPGRAPPAAEGGEERRLGRACEPPVSRARSRTTPGRVRLCG